VANRARPTRVEGPREEEALRGLTIRREEPRDFRAVEELTREAFWGMFQPRCDEHLLVHLLPSGSRRQAAGASTRSWRWRWSPAASTV
jgi:hypothetical protein